MQEPFTSSHTHTPTTPKDMSTTTTTPLLKKRNNFQRVLATELLSKHKDNRATSTPAVSAKSKRRLNDTIANRIRSPDISMIANALNKIQNSSSDEDARVITVEADIHEAPESVQSVVGNDMTIDPSIQISNIVSSSSSENEKQSNSKAHVVVPNAFNNRTAVQSVGHGPLQLGTRLPDAAQAHATDTLPNTEQNVAGPRRSNRTRKSTNRCSFCTEDKHSGHPGKKRKQRIRPSKRKQH